VTNLTTQTQQVRSTSPIATRIRAILPTGGTLADDVWRRRHWGIVILLWLHVPALFIFAVATGKTPAHALVDAGAVGLPALAAQMTFHRRRDSTIIATIGLMTASAVLVHISGGMTEAHFHFFIMVAVVVLYQEWWPFLIAIAFVVIHHGIVGSLAPQSVYGNPAAWRDPWKWAIIHGISILGMSASCIVTWRLNEAFQQATLDREHKLAEAQRVAGVGSWEWDMRSDTFTLSAELYRILDVSPQEFQHSFAGIAALYHPEDRDMMTGYLRRAYRSLEPTLFTGRTLTAAGQVTWIEVRAEVQASVDGTPVKVVGTTLDITERKRAEERLAILNADLERRVEERTAEAERANQAKSEFLSRMSHELRTPLNAILGFAQLLGMDELSADHAGTVDHILAGGGHLLQLINEVLDLSFIESGRFAVSVEPIPLGQVLDEALGLLGPQGAALAVSLPLESPVGRHVRVMADKQRLLQVIINLLSNAVKYNVKGGSVSLACEERDGGRLRVSVTDTGPGIPAEDIHRVFEPFERLSESRSEVEGTGLGLAVSQRLAEAMGAELGLTSVVGEGSTFWVDLLLAEDAAARPPVDYVAGQPSVHPVTAEATVDSGVDAGTVLYIEDNPSNIRLVEAIMKTIPNVNLVTAVSGRGGLEVATTSLPDLIILDLGLPDMPGAAVLAKLKDDVRTAAIPVVIASADATEASVQRLLAAGAKTYLTKPLDVPLFMTVVAGALRERASPGVA
jgi:signal transduction histidine kinase/CheY-like chemotaxis protein